MKKAVILLVWIAFWAAIVFLLSSCSATGGALTVKVPVPVECREPTPERPRMPTDSLRPGGKLFEAVTAMQAEIEVREGYEHRLRTALGACQKPIKPD